MTYAQSYSIIGNSTYIYDIAGNGHWFCQAVRVVTTYTDILTHVQTVDIEIQLATGNPIIVSMARSEMCRNPVPKLSSHGLSVHSGTQYMVTLIEILLDTEQSAVTKWTHSTLGSAKLNGANVFLGNQLVGDPTLTSHYIGNTIYVPSGTYDEWCNGVLELTREQPALQLALAIAASAPIAGLLYAEAVLDNVPVIAFINTSSCGKTTALELIASTAMNPSKKDGGIITAACTQNYFFAQLADRYSWPLVIDDTANCRGWDFEEVIYELADGQEYGRCGSDGKPKPRRSWSGTVILTGETNLLEGTSHNTGLLARLLQFTNAWTKDAHQAEAVKAFAKSHYGVAYNPLVEKLLEMGIDALKCAFSAARVDLTEIINPRSNVEGRLLKSAATILTSARIIKDVWKMEINEVAIKELILEAFEQARHEDWTQHVYEYIKAEVLAQKVKFPTSANHVTTASFWGMIGSEDGKRCVWIPQARFLSLLKDLQIEDKKSILQALHARGWMAKFAGNHYMKSIQIDGISVKCYCLYLRDSDAPHQKARLAKVKSAAQLSSLLATNEPANEGNSEG